MLGARLLWGPILIVLFAALFWWDAQWGETAPCLWGLALLIGWRSVWELRGLLQTRSFAPNYPLVLGCVGLMISSNWLTRTSWGQFGLTSQLALLAPPMLAFALGVMALFASGCIRYRQPGASMESLGAELIMLVYAGVFLSLTVQLRWVAGSELAYLPLGSVIVIPRAADIMAYTCGRLFGKAKLVPYLSPGKTWAGAYGALGGAAFASWAWFYWGLMWVAPSRAPFPWYWSVLYGLILGITGMMGDLAESLIKRDVGKKDSLPLVPGFGGLLDIIDSVIYSAPAAYLLWLVLPW